MLKDLLRSFGPPAEMVGKTIYKIDGLTLESDLVEFYCTDGTKYHMTHHQD